MDEKEIEDKCLSLIDKSATKVDLISSEAFVHIGQKTLAKLVKRDTLDADELQIYKSCIQWAEAECKRQQIEVMFHLKLAKPIQRMIIKSLQIQHGVGNLATADRCHESTRLCPCCIIVTQVLL